MKLTSLVHMLQDILATRGDFPVDACGNWGDPFEIDEVEITTEDRYHEGMAVSTQFVRLSEKSAGK